VVVVMVVAAVVMVVVAAKSRWSLQIRSDTLALHCAQQDWDQIMREGILTIDSSLIVQLLFHMRRILDTYFDPKFLNSTLYRAKQCRLLANLLPLELDVFCYAQESEYENRRS
jgi:hypothetical protein